jgi:hypothetical protein
MNFLHLSLLAGLAAMAVPVALHLLSRRQPKMVMFPAVRFVKHTVMQQRSSWQLRHFLLLMLRVAIVGALAVALARPRVHSAMLGTAVGLGILAAAAVFASLVALIAAATRRGLTIWGTAAAIALALWLMLAVWSGVAFTSGPVVPRSDDSAPVAAVLVIDTGPSMDYRTENEKRFRAAQETAAWILAKLPLDSRVGILTNAPLGSLALDPAAAKGQLDVLQPQAASLDLPGRIQTALELVLASELERKEVYVITDLMSHSWSNAPPELPQRLSQHAREVLLQIIDIGTTQPINYQLGDLPNDVQSVPEGSDVSWELTVARSPDTPGSVLTLELLQEALDPRLPILRNGQMELPPSQVIDRKIVDLTRGSDALVTLGARGLAPGSHNFQFRLDTSDPLEIDNTRYATVVAQAQQSALVVAEDSEAGRFMRLVLNPTEADGSGDSSLTQQVRYGQLAQVPLERFGVLCLVDPPSLPPSTVALIEQHVERGGGLLITLGPALGTPEDAAASAMTRLLPGQPVRVGRRARQDRSAFLVPAAVAHPLFHIFGSVAEDVPWNRFPLFRFWEYERLADNVQVLMSSSDRGLPLVTLQPRGGGQIMVVATPLPAGDVVGQVPWNELTMGADPWPAFGLILGAVRVLSGQTQARFNFLAGETVSLANDASRHPDLYELFTPAGQSRRVQASDGMLLLGTLEQAGTYRLRGLQGGLATRGVSVNTPAASTRLERLAPEQLDALLGAGNYRVARSRDEVESSVGQARYGRELFPMLMVVVACLFLAEQAMSNRFYELRLSPAGSRA